jgi:hypothetical protein
MLGVMRFLQMEWHNHERARNAWDIERAEMKIRMGKQEGDNRKAKAQNEGLEKQIKMLEKALKNERAGKKTSTDGMVGGDDLQKANGDLMNSISDPEPGRTSDIRDPIKTLRLSRDKSATGGFFRCRS